MTISSRVTRRRRGRDVSTNRAVDNVAPSVPGRHATGRHFHQGVQYRRQLNLLVTELLQQKEYRKAAYALDTLCYLFYQQQQQQQQQQVQRPSPAASQRLRGPTQRLAAGSGRATATAATTATMMNTTIKGPSTKSSNLVDISVVSLEIARNLDLLALQAPRHFKRLLQRHAEMMGETLVLGLAVAYMQRGQYQQAYEHLITYLHVEPFKSNPHCHAYAGMATLRHPVGIGSSVGLAHMWDALNLAVDQELCASPAWLHSTLQLIMTLPARRDRRDELERLATFSRQHRQRHADQADIQTFTIELDLVLSSSRHDDGGNDSRDGSGSGSGGGGGGGGGDDADALGKLDPVNPLGTSEDREAILQQYQEWWQRRQRQQQR